MNLACPKLAEWGGDSRSVKIIVFECVPYGTSIEPKEAHCLDTGNLNLDLSELEDTSCVDISVWCF
jgi:hypothetical protein